MKLLSYSDSDLHKLGAHNTAREIQQQPEVWMKIYNLIRESSSEIDRFFEHAVSRVDRIILTGAGTSAYIGMSLEGAFRRKTGLDVQAVSTTDLVTHPSDHFNRKKNVLLISFARSGDSPESIAAMELADQVSAKAYHLVITCDPEGKLFRNCTSPESYAVLLPEECNDKSLAMTSSFTGMLLAGLLVARISEIEGDLDNVRRLVKYGERILGEYLENIKHIASLDFKRAIFLGSGPQLGTATEAQLKVQEMTDGKVIGKVDSFLGFRHGPKAVTDTQTLVVYHFSNTPYVLQYEQDLLRSMKQGKTPMFQTGIFENAADSEKFEFDLDLRLVLSEDPGIVDEGFLAVCNVLPGQMIGFFKSVNMGLKPDNPSESGAISRVVEGVKIYPYKNS